MKRRKVVEQFADVMEMVLKQNDYKDGWKGCSNDYLIEKLNEECDELKHALEEVTSYLGDNRLFMNIIEEATDVANIVMMIADNNKLKDYLRFIKLYGDK